MAECVRNPDDRVRRHPTRNADDQAAFEADARIRTAPISLQRLFVFLTEEEEAERHANNA